MVYQMMIMIMMMQHDYIIIIIIIMVGAFSSYIDGISLWVDATDLIF
jgi:hypothetical protein